LISHSLLPIFVQSFCVFVVSRVQKKSTGKVRIVYTLWSNLHKTKGMADGAVAFHDDRAVSGARNGSAECGVDAISLVE
jgi:hypothetical protein